MLRRADATAGFPETHPSEKRRIDDTGQTPEIPRPAQRAKPASDILPQRVVNTVSGFDAEIVSRGTRKVGLVLERLNVFIPPYEKRISKEHKNVLDFFEYRLELTEKEVERRLRIEGFKADIQGEEPDKDAYIQLSMDDIDLTTLPPDTIIQGTKSGTGHCNIQGLRPSNEDEHLIEVIKVHGTNVAVRAIFDGHGGQECATFAKKNLVRILGNHLIKATKDKFDLLNIWNALKISMVNLSRSFPIIPKATGNSAGTTANICFVLKDEKGLGLWTSNVGDSRAFLVYPDGKYKMLSSDATPLGNVREITKRKGVLMGENLRVNGTLLCGRALGDHYLNGAISARPKIVRTDLPDNPEGILLIQCCDGVFEQASVHQIVETVNKHRGQLDNQALARLIVGSAFVSGSQDNISALVTDIKHMYP
jgi:serine/threonine protein phosphatase PrpC